MFRLPMTPPTLHHDRQHILATDETAVKERQTGRHQHDETAAQEHEAGVAGVDRHQSLLRMGSRHSGEHLAPQSMAESDADRTVAAADADYTQLFSEA